MMVTNFLYLWMTKPMKMNDPHISRKDRRRKAKATNDLQSTFLRLVREFKDGFDYACVDEKVHYNERDTEELLNRLDWQWRKTVNAWYKTGDNGERAKSARSFRETITQFLDKMESGAYIKYMKPYLISKGIPEAELPSLTSLDMARKKALSPERLHRRLMINRWLKRHLRFRLWKWL